MQWYIDISLSTQRRDIDTSSTTEGVCRIAMIMIVALYDARGMSSLKGDGVEGQPAVKKFVPKGSTAPEGL